MLGSAHDGERASAARMADEMVRDTGLTWAQLLDQSRPDKRPDHVIAAAMLLQHPDQLTKWEIDFCRGLHRFVTLSDRQAEVLDRLIGKPTTLARSRRSA